MTARRALVLLAALSLAYGAWGALRDAEREEGLLWDLDYYRTAAARWQAGLDPYLAEGRPTGYYYSLAVTPLVARAVPAIEADWVFGALLAAAVVAALALAVAAARPRRGERGEIWLFALAFGNAEALYVLAAGNLAALVGLALALAIWSAARDRWLLFYLLVGVCALVKPYTLLLLLAPLALRRASPLAGLAIAPWAADLALSRLLAPELAASRLEAIRLGVIEPLQLRYSLAGRLSRALADLTGLEPAAATAIAVAVQLAVAGALVLTLRRNPAAAPRRAFALAVVAAFAALPRMAGYDAFVFGPFLFAAFAPTGAERERPLPWATRAFGLLKEGLAVLPILALAERAGAGRRGGGPRPGA